MKATLVIPGHPAHFGGFWTQVEIDVAFATYDQMFSHILTKGNHDAVIPITYRVDRSEKAQPGVIFDESGIEWQAEESLKGLRIDQFQSESLEEIGNILHGVTALLEEKRPRRF